MREGNPWKPDIFLLQNEGERVLVKDYAAKPFVFRFFVGMIVTKREAFIYKKLQGIQGIPKCYGLIDRYAIAIEYIPGRNGEELIGENFSPSFFDKMREVIDTVHNRGVVLCDRRNVKNILMREDGRPYLIDFATAFQKGGRLNFIKNALYRILYQDDLLGIAKLKRTSARHLLSEEERLSLEKGLFLEKEAKFIKSKGLPFLRKLFGLGRQGGKDQASGSKRLQ